MQTLRNKKPIKIGAIALGIAAVLALAFFFAPGVEPPVSVMPAATTAAETALTAIEQEPQLKITTPPLPAEFFEEPDIETDTQDTQAETDSANNEASTTAPTALRPASATVAAYAITENTQAIPATIRTTTTRVIYINPNTTAAIAVSTTAAATTAPITTTVTTQQNIINQPTQPQLTVALSISCAAVLGNEHMLRPNRNPPLPPNGVILAPVTVNFTEGDTVLAVLLRETRARGIQMEHRSGYVRGINNLYEFDFGPLSGWMYKINGAFPGMGAGDYVLRQGDVIEWVYTLNLGDDIGGGYAAG